MIQWQHGNTPVSDNPKSKWAPPKSIADSETRIVLTPRGYHDMLNDRYVVTVQLEDYPTNIFVPVSLETDIGTILNKATKHAREHGGRRPNAR